jgi:hypothetical protein
MRTIYDGKDTVQQELQPDGTWKEVGRGQRQTDRDQQPQPITPVTIVDPKDPTKTLVVDGRTGRVIGAAPKETPQGKREADARFKMRGLGDAIQEADDILSGVKRDADGNVTRAPLPTSSGIGKGYDAAAGFFGASPSGAAEAQRLKVVAGVLTSKVPRMEGPQSNLDVELYKQMAADAGNEALPIPRRLAAVREMKRLYGKYEHLQGDAGATQPPGAPAAPSPAQRAPGGPVEGQTATNRATGKKLIFRGGKWQPM